MGRGERDPPCLEESRKTGREAKEAKQGGARYKKRKLEGDRWNGGRQFLKQRVKNKHS